ncbi:MAG: hypothetical protein RSB86_17915 [Comamonas sp.]|jgi:hypothetical protein|uniref:hypothetical protein n=1 Tax=Comamonas sp. TaxID=34028 RepID=UPI0028DC95DE|nr:hypothetical protein [uncultured Comamonas sp.]
MNLFSRMHALRTPFLGWWLAMALVLAPALGRMHEVLHAPQLTQQSQAAAEHVHGVAAWFAGHDALACLVIDQLGHGASATPPAVAVIHPQPAQPPEWMSEAHLLPSPIRIFLARAPPEGFMA